MTAQRTVRVVVLGAVVLSAVALLAPAVAQDPAPRPAAEEFAWLSGVWEYSRGQQSVEEYWTPVSSNGLLGMGRTLADGRTVSFEFLRIEWRDDGVYYVAQPRGRPQTDFKLVRWDGAQAVFENPTHDFPQRVLYRRNADGSVDARIEGLRNGRLAGVDFPYKRRN